MDRTVPAGAARLLDFIGLTEAPNGYGTIYANKQGMLAKPLTEMTLDDVLAAQPRWSKNHGSSAAGRYQFMRATLLGLRSELHLRGSQKLDGDLQDRLGYHLLIRRGYSDFMAGKIGRIEFGKRLAQEWASFPVLKSVKGAHRTVARGETYYAGDKLNKVLVKPEKVEAVLDEVLKLRPFSTGPVSGPPELGTPIPGTVKPAEPVAPPAPAYVERNPFWAALFAFLKVIFGRKR
ncbi:lysozyme family protein [Mesorhizobium sp. A623]